MNAHALRKWSLAKILMYLWLPAVLMLLALMCGHGAGATETPMPTRYNNAPNHHFYHHDQQPHHHNYHQRQYDNRNAAYVAAQQGLLARLSGEHFLANRSMRRNVDDDVNTNNNNHKNNNNNNNNSNKDDDNKHNSSPVTRANEAIVPNVPKHSNQNSQIIINVSDYLSNASSSVGISVGSRSSSSNGADSGSGGRTRSRLSDSERSLQRNNNNNSNNNYINHNNNNIDNNKDNIKLRNEVRGAVNSGVASIYSDNDEGIVMYKMVSSGGSASHLRRGVTTNDDDLKVLSSALRQPRHRRRRPVHDTTTNRSTRIKDGDKVDVMDNARLVEKLENQEFDRIRLSHNNIHHDDNTVMNSDFDEVMAARNRRESRHQHDGVASDAAAIPSGRHHTTALFPPPRLQHQQQQQRSQRRFCSARDPKTLAFEAPTVFEGKVKSMSSDRRKNFSVTFEVMRRHKEQQGGRLPALVRLPFAYRNTSECDIYRESFKARGYVREELLEQGKVYILFVEQLDVGNYTILGQPIRKTRRTVTEVRQGVDEKYGQRAVIESLMANNTREGKRIRIVCKVRGQPPPKVTWFKDGRSISRNRTKYQFIHLRRRSELLIKSATKSDMGQYECRAKNKLDRKPTTQSIRIEVLSKENEATRYFPAPPNNWTNLGSECPTVGNAFCLNGGTCVFFKDVGEPACKCPDGFLGNRCETKNPTNHQPSMPLNPRYYGVGSPDGGNDGGGGGGRGRGGGGGGSGGGGTTAHELTDQEMQRVKELHQKQQQQHHHNRIMRPIRMQLFHF